jgi:hypothetical protein
LAIPAEAQDLIVSCRDNPLYEAIKDFALDRTVRTDIWAKEGGKHATNQSELFGGFAYGIVLEPNQIPPAFAAQGKVIDLSGPLYAKLIDSHDNQHQQHDAAAPCWQFQPLSR